MSTLADPRKSVRWTTDCCGRTPAHIGDYRYVCRVCGLIYVDTAAEIRALFGPGVERCIATPGLYRRLLIEDHYEWISDQPKDQWS